MTGTLSRMKFGEPGLEADEDAVTVQTSFTALVERHSRFVFRVAYSVLRNVSDADDVVQETFLKLYRNRQWEHLENERAFLARAAWRMAVDRRPKACLEAPDPGLASQAASPEQAAITADWNAFVQRLVDALPEDLRRPLALATVEELKSQEISEIMGIPEGTVRTRLARARQILKQKLGVVMAGPHGK